MSVLRTRANKYYPRNESEFTCLFYGGEKIKSVQKIDINVNTSIVKHTNDEEPAVTDIAIIKVPGYFKLFKCFK